MFLLASAALYLMIVGAVILAVDHIVARMFQGSSTAKQALAQRVGGPPALVDPSL